MKFASRHAGHAITFNSGTTRAIVSPGGATSFIENGDFFNVKFEEARFSAAEIEAAKEQLFSGAKEGNAFGSTPSRDEGLISVDEAVAAGYAHLNYDGYDVYQNLGSFDTEDPRVCPPQIKDEVEQFLLGHQEYGVVFVRVDNYNLTPPWPTYPLGPEVNIANVVRFAQAGGFLVEALTYEVNVGQRLELIEAYKVALAKEQAEAEEDAGLSARV